jgi:cell division septation protein DedD
MTPKTTIIALLLGVSAFTFLPVPPAIAQSVDNLQPAEFPPESFNGHQYVDSKGCVFIRAGIDGAITWIPRVTRKRSALCGFKPSLAGSAIADLPVIPDPAPRIAVAPAAPVRAPSMVKPVRPSMTHAPTPAPVAARPTAPDLPTTTAGLVHHPIPLNKAVGSVRAGSHGQKPQILAPDATPAPVAAPAAIRAAGLYEGQVLTAPPVDQVRVPKGYRPAWDDGRLNPDRGKQTLQGALQTALIWTQTVPRRLVDETGRDMTREYNYLVFPYTDYGKQQRDLAGGQHIVVRTGGGDRFIVAKDRLSVSPTTGKTVLSSKSPAPRQPAVVAAKQPVNAVARPAPQGVVGRFVQVGTFAQGSNANATAARLQRAGLPVRIGEVNRGGRALQIVLAGPFPNPSQAQSALSSVHRAGFADAFLRN